MKRIRDEAFKSLSTDCKLSTRAIAILTGLSSARAGQICRALRCASPIKRIARAEEMARAAMAGL